MAIAIKYRHSNMELRHIRYFVAVAEELNFRRAAVRLNVAQPPLSTQVRQLEEEIGARLLDRNSHSVTLTAAGSIFLEQSRRILRSVEGAVRATRRAAQGETGSLSVGFVASLSHGLLPGILRAYRRQYPDVELSLTEMDTTQQIEALTTRQLDLGFIGLGLPRESPDLELVTVIEEQLVAVLPLEHPLAADCRARRRRSLPLSKLKGERFYLADRGNAPVYNPWLVVLCQQAGFQPHIVHEADRLPTVLSYVAAGFGVTILPAQFGRLATPDVFFIPLARPVPKYRYCAAWRRGEGDTPALKRFLAIARRTTPA